MGRFKTEEEVIELANNTLYGLGAGLHSSGSRVCFSIVVIPRLRLQPRSSADANQCLRVSSALEAGTVSDLVATSGGALCLLDGDPPGLNSPSLGLGEPIQRLAQ